MESPNQVYDQFFDCYDQNPPFNVVVDESEAAAVDELLQILMDCLNQGSMETKQILLRKFFREIEKDSDMESYLVERLKQSNYLNSFLSSNSDSEEEEEEEPVSGIKSREVDFSSAEVRMERFKVKTLQVREEDESKP